MCGDERDYLDMSHLFREGENPKSQMESSLWLFQVNPNLKTRHIGIWTIIDRFNKQAHFILVRKDIKADWMA